MQTRSAGRPASSSGVASLLRTSPPGRPAPLCGTFGATKGAPLTRVVFSSGSQSLLAPGSGNTALRCTWHVPCFRLNQSPFACLRRAVVTGVTRPGAGRVPLPAACLTGDRGPSRRVPSLVRGPVCSHPARSPGSHPCSPGECRPQTRHRSSPPVQRWRVWLPAVAVLGRSDVLSHPAWGILRLNG